MSLSISVRLRGGRYDAGGERPSEGEWPPHPARLFCALVASAQDDADWEALRWLERQSPPQVWCDPDAAVVPGRASAYVVLNSVKEGGGNQNWPGRTNGLRARSFAVPPRDSFAFMWPEAEPTESTLARLQRLAWNVPYLGRSTSLAQASAIGSAPSDLPGWVIYGPADRGASGRTRDLRVPYPGYCDELRAAYQTGRRSWEIARSRPYLEMRSDEMTADQADAHPAAGPFSDLMVWGIERPVTRIGGDQVIAIATSLRKAIMDLVPDPVPGQVSGHTEPGVPHVAFLVLPDVDHDHADGHVLGVGLALPDGLPSDDLKSLLRAVLNEPSLRYVGFGGRKVAVRYGGDGVGLRSSRWMASAGGEREWVTVTPIALDGHTRRKRDEASEVARSLVIAGYPMPLLVETSMTPMLTGAVWRPRRDTWPDGRPRRQMVHARVRFPDPVIGPVLAGSMRYLGLGLFKPVSQRRAGHSADSAAGPIAAHRAEVAAEAEDASEVAEVTR